MFSYTQDTWVERGQVIMTPFELISIVYLGLTFSVTFAMLIIKIYRR